MSTKPSRGSAPSDARFRRHLQHGAPPLSGAMLAITVVALAAALVLGYLLLDKLADISRQEDCLFHHSKWCPVIELPGHQV